MSDLVLPYAIVILGFVVSWFGARRSRAVAISALFICLSSGVMLWMLTDFLTDPSYSTNESYEDWVFWFICTISNLSALAVMAYSVWRFNHKTLMIAAGLSSVSIIFPVGILAGLVAWWGLKNDAKIALNRRVEEHPRRQSGGKADLPLIAQLMEEGGFRNVTMYSDYDGLSFQIVAQGRIGIQKLPTLLRTVGTLDENSAEGIVEEFLDLHKKKSSYFIGSFFLYCLIAERAEPQAVEWLIGAIDQGTQGMKDTFKGGGGHLMIVDVSSGTLLVRRSRVDTDNHGRMLAEILVRVGLVRP